MTRRTSLLIVALVIVGFAVRIAYGDRYEGEPRFRTIRQELEEWADILDS